MRVRDARTIYAQTSDIKGRTFIEYRRDMKRKAISELEVLDWLHAKMQERYPGRKVKVSKYGGDKFLWFLRAGGVSREPDFIVQIDGTAKKLEFQYAEKAGLDFYDFTLSKVARKQGGRRIPKSDVEFVYILKPEYKFAFFKPEWILAVSQVGEVPAWRKDAYRIPREVFEAKLKYDPALEPICRMIDAKNYLLEFQHLLIDITRDELSHLLQKVIDEDQLVSIMPKDLESFFKVRFILEHLDRSPTNSNLWLIYLTTYIKPSLDSQTAFKIAYCFDFLYTRVELKENELAIVVQNIKALLSIIRSMAHEDGSFRSSPRLSPIDETRYSLFVINLLEDLTQDILHYYSGVELEPISKIFKHIPSPRKTFEFLTSNVRGPGS